MYTCEHVCVPLWELMYVFERMCNFKRSCMKSASGILRQWSVSYNSSQIGMHTNLFYSLVDKYREALTCYIWSNLASCYMPFPYWNSTNVPGRKIVILFRSIKTAISPQPLDEILWTKTIKIISWSQAPFIIMCAKESVTWRDNLKFWCFLDLLYTAFQVHHGRVRW